MSRSLSLCRLFVSVALILALVSCGKIGAAGAGGRCTAGRHCCVSCSLRARSGVSSWKAISSPPRLQLEWPAGRARIDGQLPDWSAAYSG